MKSKFIYTILGTIITTIALVFGQGIIMKPKISISSGAIDYKIPAKYQMELFMWKMMMKAEDFRKEMSIKMTTLLREYGFPEDKIKLITAKLEKKK